MTRLNFALSRVWILFQQDEEFSFDSDYTLKRFVPTVEDVSTQFNLTDEI